MPEGRERILVVETDPTISDIVARQALQAAGFETQLVNDFNTALNTVTRFKPHILIVELNLPGMSAKDLMVALSSQGLDLPVIVLATKGDESKVIQTFRVGATDYLLWPFQEPEVIAVVERVLTQVRMRREREELSLKLEQSNKELEQRLRHLTIISEIGKAFTSVTNLSQLFDKVLEGALSATQAEVGWLMILDEAKKTFVLTTFRNLPASVSNFLDKPWNEKLCNDVARVAETVEMHGDLLNQYEISRLGKSALIVPISVKNQVVGLLAVMRKESKLFSTSDRNMMEAVADYASISLMNAYLFRAIEERARAFHVSAEAALMNQKVIHALVRSIRQEVQISAKRYSNLLEGFLQDEGPKLEARQQKKIATLQSEIMYLQSLANAISIVPVDPVGQLQTNSDVGHVLKSILREMDPLFRQLSIHVPLTLLPDGVTVSCNAGLLKVCLEGVIKQALRISQTGKELVISMGEVIRDSVQIAFDIDISRINHQQLEDIYNQDLYFIDEKERRFVGLVPDLATLRELLQTQKGDLVIESSDKGGARILVNLHTI